MCAEREAGDKFNLKRFRDAQKKDYPAALREIRAGRKRSHWIWYVFPQLAALGFSSTAKYYGISSLDEARAYLGDSSLRANLIEISSALLELASCDARRVMGDPDDMKLRSSMTLFSEADPSCEIFRKVLDKFFGGEKDGRTLALLSGRTEHPARA